MIQEQKAILIVDDEPDTAFLFAHRLQKYTNFTLSQAYSGIEGRQKFDQQHYDLVVLDIRVETVDAGLVLLKYIKEKAPSIPVIIMTAYDDTPNRLSAHQCGAEHYVIKPIDFNSLTKRINSILSTNK
jgi:DNA-binding response OmpR family regulator